MKSVGFALVAFGLAGHAMAGGMNEPVPEAPVIVAAEPAPSFDWTGFYVGANIGFGELESDTTSADTSFYGVQAGYLQDLGTFVLGGELAYTTGDFDDIPDSEYDSTRLKLIGGYDAGRFLPYAFVGLSEYEISDADSSISDTATIYGLGARYALGETGQHMVGLEYLMETKDDFNDSEDDLDNSELSLRYDFRF